MKPNIPPAAWLFGVEIAPLSASIIREGVTVHVPVFRRRKQSLHAAARRFIAGCVAVVLLAFTTSARADKPQIGLVYAAEQLDLLERRGEDGQSLYRRAITRHGAEIVVLGQTDAPGALMEKLNRIHAVCLPGGIDIDPKNYGEERHPKLEKTDDALDQMQFAVLRRARDRGLPVLGICLGHQTINVCYGGTLYQDLPSELNAPPVVAHRGGEPPAHELSIAPNSLLHGLLGVDRLTVNSYHHQGIKRLAPGFVATARTADGLIEAIEHHGPPFVLGVQFHPERMVATDPRMNAIFARFVAEARKSMALPENIDNDEVGQSVPPKVESKHASGRPAQ